MNSRAYLLVLMLIGQSAFAASEEDIIKKMINPNGLSEAQIREHYKSGCDTGAYVPMLTCGRFHYLYADAELNEAYQSLLKQLTTEKARVALKAAEKAWVIYRDATCEYETEGVSDGRFWSVYNFGCLTTVTEQRVSKLKEYLKCQDPGCPGEW
jgi:uncharacterized protein YecT (DUF1311 family)